MATFEDGSEWIQIEDSGENGPLVIEGAVLCRGERIDVYNINGVRKRLYRPKSEVCSASYLSSISGPGKLITMGHPGDDTDPSRSVGFVNRAIAGKSEAFGDLVVYDPAARGAIVQGVGLSPKYDCQIDWTPGSSQDLGPWDGVIRNLRSTSIGLVGSPRQGIHLDSSGTTLSDSDSIFVTLSDSDDPVPDDAAVDPTPESDPEAVDPSPDPVDSQPEIESKKPSGSQGSTFGAIYAIALEEGVDTETLSGAQTAADLKRAILALYNIHPDKSDFAATWAAFLVQKRISGLSQKSPDPTPDPVVDPVVDPDPKSSISKDDAIALIGVIDSICEDPKLAPSRVDWIARLLSGESVTSNLASKLGLPEDSSLAVISAFIKGRTSQPTPKGRGMRLPNIPDQNQNRQLQRITI